MSGFAAPSPGRIAPSQGVLCRVHVKGAGVFSTVRTTLEHAEEIRLRFVADLVAALHPDQVLPLVPFPAADRESGFMVRADQVSVIEVVRVDGFGRTR